MRTIGLYSYLPSATAVEERWQEGRKEMEEVPDRKRGPWCVSHTKTEKRSLKMYRLEIKGPSIPSFKTLDVSHERAATAGQRPN